MDDEDWSSPNCVAEITEEWVHRLHRTEGKTLSSKMKMNNRYYQELNQNRIKS